jgi:hypothetical protein
MAFGLLPFVVATSTCLALSGNASTRAAKTNYPLCFDFWPSSHRSSARRSFCVGAASGGSQQPVICGKLSRFLLWCGRCGGHVTRTCIHQAAFVAALVRTLRAVLCHCAAPQDQLCARRSMRAPFTLDLRGDSPKPRFSLLKKPVPLRLAGCAARASRGPLGSP